MPVDPESRAPGKRSQPKSIRGGRGGGELGNGRKPALRQHPNPGSMPHVGSISPPGGGTFYFGSFDDDDPLRLKSDSEGSDDESFKSPDQSPGTAKKVRFTPGGWALSAAGSLQWTLVGSPSTSIKSKPSTDDSVQKFLNSFEKQGPGPSLGDWSTGNTVHGGETARGKENQ